MFISDGNTSIPPSAPKAKFQSAVSKVKSNRSKLLAMAKTMKARFFFKGKNFQKSKTLIKIFTQSDEGADSGNESMPRQNPLQKLRQIRQEKGAKNHDIQK